ncbi:DUF2493 domain-containing protein [Roseibium aggregatum]|uniref:YspA cpYpsA-related SLOG domain-containing protein n=1 Tax=Roseibium aggregatum TaxID=187304 RepID=A0A0M6Y9Q6_9HYPH|nr:DUF2493 domain-containing protein [Roseibium aggregatum]CTQ45741.1 hypothetical protein LAL4801_04196 [Roseibium aggregatum]
MLNVIVTGGRDYDDGPFVSETLSKLHASRSGPITRLVNGGARGVDTFAKDWAIANGVQVVTVKADWDRFGKGAGPIRNREMAFGYPDSTLVAFPGNSGTKDMIQVALDHGMMILQYGEPANNEPDLFGGLRSSFAHV